MKSLLKYTCILLFISQACAQADQQTGLQAYDLVNLPEGVTDIEYGLYPANTIIEAGTYKNLSEVKNETVEELLASDLSEQSLEWYRFNRDFESEDDLSRDYTKIYNDLINDNSNYELLSLLTFKFKGTLYANTLIHFNIKAGVSPLVFTRLLIKKGDRWYFVEKSPKELRRFFIGVKRTQSSSVYNILNKTPQNSGESALLDQSQDEEGNIDFEKLSDALFTIRDQAEANSDIEAILLPDGF